MYTDRLLSVSFHGRPALRAALISLSLAAAACSNDLPGPTATDPGLPATTAPGPDFAETVPNTWNSRIRMPTGRFGLVAASVNGVVYAIGGWRGGMVLQTVEAYKPSTNTLVAWTPKAPLPSARLMPNGAAVINGKIYVSGGTNAEGQATSTLFVYDVAGNAWFAKAPMPINSHGGASAAINGKLYVLVTPPGQAERFTGPARLFHYDPATNKWSERATAPHHHHRGVARAINGKLYVAGGMTMEDLDGTGWDQPKAWAEVDVYDPVTNTWAARVPMPTARWGAVASVMDDKLYVAGGWTDLTPKPSLEVYDPATNTWAARADMPTARGGAGAGVVNGVLYVLGGRTSLESGALRTNEAYTK